MSDLNRDDWIPIIDLLSLIGVSAQFTKLFDAITAIT
jgi:hypothetical protein